MRKFTLLFSFLFSLALYGQSPSTFINEINYLANDPTGRGIELAGPAGSNLNDNSVAVYAADGTLQFVEYLADGVIPNQQNGYGTIWYDVDQMTGPGGGGGVALLDGGGNVVQFLAYGVSMYSQLMLGAVDGPAAGMAPEYAGASLLPGSALQLGGSGNEYLDFSWLSPLLGSSPGSINPNQNFLAELLGGLLGGLFTQSDQATDQQYNRLDEKELSPVSVRAFPNPASDLLQVNLSSSSERTTYTVSLLNLTGQTVQSVQAGPGEQTQLAVSHLPSGNYLLVVESADERRVQKIVVE